MALSDQSNGQPAWLISWLGETAGPHDMIIVRADSKTEAAEAGADALEAQVNSDANGIYVAHVQVWLLTDVGEWFGISWPPKATVAEKQCCGHSGDGHSGYCPERQSDA